MASQNHLGVIKTGYREKDQTPFLRRLMLGDKNRDAQVILRVPQVTAEAGGRVNGEVQLLSGSKDTVLEMLSIDLVIDYDMQVQGANKTVNKSLHKVKVMDRMTLHSKTPEITLPFKLQIPHAIPNTSDKVRYELRVSMQQNGLKSSSAPQMMSISPNNYQRLLFGSVESLGFSLTNDCGEYINGFQRFKFMTSICSKNEVEEINLFLVTGEKAFEMLLDVRKRNSEASNTRPPVRVNLPYTGFTSIEYLRPKISQILTEIA